VQLVLYVARMKLIKGIFKVAFRKVFFFFIFVQFFCELTHLDRDFLMACAFVSKAQAI